MGSEAARVLIRKHITQNKPTNPNSLKFHAYNFLADNQDSVFIFSELENLILPYIGEIDYFVPLIKSGISISTYLHFKLGKPLFFPKETTHEVRKNIIDPNQHNKLCLVDTSINTRGSFILNLVKLEKFNLFPDRLLVLFFNDLWPNENITIKNLADSNRLHSLVSASELKDCGLL